MTQRSHLVLGAIFCVILPALSWIDGSGRLAYTMFADVHWYRLRIVASDDAGRAREISPTLLANAAGGSAAPFFAGADRFHLAPVSHMARLHLDDIARFACGLTRAQRITVHLLEREDEHGPERDLSGSAVCAP